MSRYHRLMAEPGDSCRVVEVDGTPVRVLGSGDMTDEELGFLAEVIAAARRRYEAESSPRGLPGRRDYGLINSSDHRPRKKGQK